MATGGRCEDDCLRVSLPSADSPYQFEAHFHKDGYIALPKSIFPRRYLNAPRIRTSREESFFNANIFCSAHDSAESIELELSTGSSDGLILWQGVVSPAAQLTTISSSC